MPAGAGELSGPLDCFGPSTSMPLALRSLTALLSIFALTSSVVELSLLTSPLNVELDRAGAAHEPASHWKPVKLLHWKPLRTHFRQGLPVRSRARRPALMAPVLALGPSLCVLIGAGPEKGPFFVASADLSMVPSAL